MVVDRNTGKVLKIHEMQNNETGREKPEIIFDKHGIMTMAGNKEKVLAAMREYAINFGNEVKKACADKALLKDDIFVPGTWQVSVDRDSILSIDVESLIEKG